MSNYTWSVCYPDKPNIEDRGLIERSRILNTFSSYPWSDQLTLLSELAYEEVNYNPSIRFTNTTNGRWLELTAEGSPTDILFSIWYSRPVIKKVLLGILGEKEVDDVVDNRPFGFDRSKEFLDLFLEEKYEELEQRLA